MEEVAFNNTPESTLTNLGQVGNARDASLEALWPLFVKIQPSLSSLLQDLANWDAARSLPVPNFDKPQETSSLAKTSQEELEQIDPSEEPSTTDGKTRKKMEEGAIYNPHERRQEAKETLARSKKFPSASHPQWFSSVQAINQQKISSFPSFPTHLDQEASSSLNAGMSQGGSVEINVEESRERKLDEYRERSGLLVEAAMKGDWRIAKAFLDKNPDCVRASITEQETTVLHIAAATQNTTFVKKLLKMMNPKDLELKTKYGFTSLHSAAQSGNVRIAKQLVKINENLLLIRDAFEHIPLEIAVYHRRTNMVSYLFSVTPLEKLTDDNCIELLVDSIQFDLYDTALKILEIKSNRANADIECCWKALTMLARKPFAIGSESQLSFWKRGLNSCFKRIFNEALMKTLAHQLVEHLWKVVRNSNKQISSNLVHTLFEAAKVGNVEFLIILTRPYPDLLWHLDENYMSIFHIAIKNRQESVFNLIYEIGSIKDSLATFPTLDTKENMLHLAGKLAPLDRLYIVSGAALQMQREVLWFKEIEKIVPRSFLNEKNKEHKTPKEIFIGEHESLKREAEKWMKNTSNNCMVVATLIAAVVFASAFTVPGGNNQEKGTPIFLRSTWFMVFFVSNAIALFSSTASMLLFLSMFVSRYSVEDFSVSVPSKLLLGLATLFISIGGMIVAFTAACILMYKGASSLAPVGTSALAAIPLILYSMGHCHELFVDLFVSQYQSRFLFGRPYKPRLFLRKMPVGE